MFLSSVSVSNQNRSRKYPTWPTLVAGSVIFCCSLICSFFYIQSLSGLLQSTEAVNILGRQRMLTQRITSIAGSESNKALQTKSPALTASHANSIAQCAREMSLEFPKVLSLLPRLHNDPILASVESHLLRSQKHLDGLHAAVRRFLAELEHNDLNARQAIFSEIFHESELFLPEIDQANLAIQMHRTTELRWFQYSLFYIALLVGLGCSVFIRRFVLSPIRLEREEKDKKLVEATRWKQLALISEKTTNLAIFTDPSCRIVWVNESFTRITGYTLEEVIGKVPGHFLQCEETCKKTVERMRLAVQNKECFSGIILNQSKHGRRYWLQIDFQPTYNEQGVHTGFVAIEMDVSEQRKAQMSLEESTRFLHGAIDSISSHIAILDEHGTILFVNSHWKQFAEANNFQGPDYGVGCNYLTITECGNNAEVETVVSEVSQGIRRVLNGECKSFEYEYPCHSTTQQRWFLMTVSRFDGNKPLRLVVSHLNITERKIAQQRLEKLNQQLTEDLKARILAEENFRSANTYLDVYRKIVDHHAIVAETDTKGTIVSVNDAFCRISGYAREELVGKNHRILNSGVHTKSMWSEMYKSVAKGGFWHGEICNRNKSGKLYWVDTTIAPLFDDSGKVRGYFAIRADITSLKEAQAQAESASLSKSEFLANMSHEIRTPMTAILGYADILAEHGHDGLSSEDAIACIDTIKKNGEHLISIINDILDISKIEAEKMTTERIEVSPVHIVRDVVELMKVKSKAKGLSLDVRFPQSIPKTISTDPTRLRQILVNLVGNAIKFTEVGGVTISVRMDDLVAERVVFDIIDTGIGLTEEQAARLFRPFEQADTSMTRKFGGTGLGLRISKRLAEILGGDISVACSVGGGCVFSASVATGCLDGIDMTPKASIDPPSRVTEKTERPKETNLSLAAVRIMVVEDGPDNQRLISFHLRKAGALVEIVENGKLAVERLSEDKTVDGPLAKAIDVNVILMDMQMPEMDGYTATRILREKGLRLPILALTAHAMDIDQDKCTAAGCDLRLTKPIAKDELIAACAQWSRRSIPFLPEAPGTSPIVNAQPFSTQ
jgi:PAS domain S-box-containing protein